MIKILNIIKKHILLIITSSIILASLCVMFTYFIYNPYHENYIINFTAEYKILNLDEDYIIKVKNKIEEERIENSYEENGITIYPYSSFSYINTKKISKNTSITYQDGIYTITSKCNLYNSWQQARRFLINIIKLSFDDVLYKLKDDYVLNDTSININDSILTKTTSIQEYKIFLISFIISFLIVSIILFFLEYFNFIKEEPNNNNLYKTPFHLKFFKESLRHLHNLRSVIMISILISLNILLSLITIPSGFSNLGLSFSYIILALIGLMYGPSISLIVGFLVDILGYLVKPEGIFFFGYTLSSMLGCLVYSLCLYKTKITFTKCLFARLIINILINSFLGTFWWWIINDKTILYTTYLLTVSLPKNIVYLIPQSIILFLVIKSLIIPISRFGIIDEDISNNVSWI